MNCTQKLNKKLLGAVHFEYVLFRNVKYLIVILKIPSDKL